jgi:hypothetical protein
MQQTLGLLTLSQPQLLDFELICADGERLGCSRKLLEARWEWFANEMRTVEARAAEAGSGRARTASKVAIDDISDEEPIDTLQRSKPSKSTALPSHLFRITTQTLQLPLPADVAKALLQYFHTLSLSTPLQRSLPVLISLLSFTKTYVNASSDRRGLVVHALHESLSAETAANIYEGALLGGSVALQLRAMQVLLSVRRFFRFCDRKSRIYSF